MLLCRDKLDVVRREVALPAVDRPKPPSASLYDDVDTVSIVKCQNAWLQQVVVVQHVPALLGGGLGNQRLGCLCGGLSLVDLSLARCRVLSTSQTRSKHPLTV